MSCSRIEAMDDFDVRKAALAKTLIEERTQARTELFRAQERVRELEDLIYGWWKRTYEDGGPLYALETEANKIATKRREGEGK